MKEDEDVELFVQGLENDLLQAVIPKAWWKIILTTRLTPTLKGLIEDLQVDSAYDFEAVKAHLLHCVGQTPTGNFSI